MDHIKVTCSKTDNGLKPTRKARSKAKNGKRLKEQKKGMKQDTSMFKSALGFFSGLLGSSKEEGAKSTKTVTEPKGDAEGVNHFNPNAEDNMKPETQSEAFANVLASSTDSQGDTTRYTETGGEILAGFESSPRQKTFATGRRHSGLLPRQTSSGINAILLDTHEHHGNGSKDSESHSPTATHIRNSYEKTKCSPLPPLRLSNIFQTRLQDGYTGQGKRQGILNQEFFASVNNQIKEIKSKPQPDKVAIVPSDEEFQFRKPAPVIMTNQTSSELTKCKNHPTNVPSTPRKESNGNVNINLTVQLGQMDGQPKTADLGDISIASQNRTVIIDARPFPGKVESAMQTETESEEQIGPISVMEGEEVYFKDVDDVSGAIDKMLGYTGDSLMSAISLVTNIVPSDNSEITEEEMNANEDDLPVILMRLMGVPQEMRHKIYLEACDEVEVLQDVTAGTIDAFGTVLKWIVGGTQGRKDLMEKTRALCAVTSEVDTESEIWYRLQKDVSDITESVEFAVNESLNTAENVAISCSENIVEFVTTATSSANFSEHESALESRESQMESIENEKEDNSRINLDNRRVEFQSSHASMHSFYGHRPYFFTDPETSFLYSPQAFRDQLRNPPSHFGPSEMSLRLAKSGKFEDEDDETLAEMMKGRESNQRSLCGKLKDDFMFPNVSYDGNNNSVDKEQTAEKCEIVDDMVGVIRRLSKSFLPHFTSPGVDSEKSLEQETSETEYFSPTSSVESLGNLPRAPQTSQVIFDKIKHDKKVLEDLDRLQELVQELYKNMTPLNSQRDESKASFEYENETLLDSQTEIQSSEYERLTPLASQSDMTDITEDTDSEYEAKEFTPAASTKTSNSTISTPPTECHKIQSKSRIPILVNKPPVAAGLTKSCIRKPSGRPFPTYSSRKNSTVSLYQSQRSSISQKSELEMINPTRYVKINKTPSFFSRTDENNNPSELSSVNKAVTVAANSTNDNSHSVWPRNSKTSLKKRDFIKENKSSVASSTTGTSASRASSRASSLAISSSYTILSSKSSSTGYSDSTDSRAVVLARRNLAKKHPISAKQSSTGSSTTSSRYSSRPPTPKSYQQIISQQKGYQAIASKYLKSTSSNGSKTSNTNTTTSTSSYASSSSTRQ